MKNENRNRELHALNDGCGQFSRRIGSTTYQVNVYFSDIATETMDDKILRLIRNEIASQGVAQPDARDYEVAA